MKDLEISSTKFAVLCDMLIAQENLLPRSFEAECLMVSERTDSGTGAVQKDGGENGDKQYRWCV